MSTAIIIVSNEGGKERAVTIAASKEGARQVVGICKRMTGSRFIGVETMAALPVLSEAWGQLSYEWEAAYRGGNGADKGAAANAGVS